MAFKYQSISISCETCLGCGNCIAACPISNPESPIFEENQKKLKLENGVARKNKAIVCWDNPEVPNDCNKCTLLCPTGAIETKKVD